MVPYFSGLARFQSFLFENVRRDISLRYLNSVAGPIWLLIMPLAQIVIFTMVFGGLLSKSNPDASGSSLNYGLFVYAGIIAWGAFSEIITRSLGMFVEYANLLKKQSFPRVLVPAVVLLSSLANFAIMLGVMILVLTVLGRFPGLAIVAVIPLTALLAGLAFGIGLLCGTLNVFIRDIGHITTTFLGFLFWLTPLVYPASALPGPVRVLVRLNPLTPIVEAFQTVVANGKWPDWLSLAYPIAIAAVLLWLGRSVFLRLSGDLVDEL